MAAGALPLDRLRTFLRELSPGARAMLAAELERTVLSGDEIPGGNMLLREVRATLRTVSAPAPRIDIDAPASAFFRPLEPFLVETQNENKAPGRIARATLEPIWTWIARDLAPDEAKAYSDNVRRALAAGDAEPPPAVVQSFQELIAGRIRTALEAAGSDERARRKMSTLIATPNALDAVRDVQTIVASRKALDSIAGQLPGHIRNLNDSTLDSLMGPLNALVRMQGSLPTYALTLVANRLAAPWQLIRVAVKGADSDDATRIAASPYAPAVTITLADIERMASELKTDLRRGFAVTSLLKCVHDALRGVRTELDLPNSSPWARQLAAIRVDISEVLTSEIESASGRVRRLIRPRAAKDIGRGALLDADEVAEADAMIGVIASCRHYAGEFAASEVTLRTFQEIQQYLDGGTRALLDALRASGDHDRAFRKSQMNAAIRFCATIFGKDYAALLAKAAEQAGNTEGKMVAKA